MALDPKLHLILLLQPPLKAPLYYCKKSATSNSPIVNWLVQKWDNMEKGNKISRAIHAKGATLLSKVHPLETFLQRIPPTPLIIDGYRARVFTDTPEPQTILQQLHSMAIERSRMHRKRFWLGIMFLPFSMACIIIPGPNIPLAYNLFRIYSNYHARQGCIGLLSLQICDVVIEEIPALPTRQDGSSIRSLYEGYEFNNDEFNAAVDRSMTQAQSLGNFEDGLKR